MHISLKQHIFFCLFVGMVCWVTGYQTGAAEAQTPQPQFPHPAFVGSSDVGRMHLELVDPSRANRPVDVDIWYPATVSPGTPKSTYDLVFSSLSSQRAYHNPPIRPGPFPVITFSHGLETINFQSYETMEHWASHGYIVVAPTHEGNDIKSKLAGTTVGFAQTILDRTGDLKFSLDIVLAVFGSHADGSLIAATGHSAGGWTAMVQANGYHGLGQTIAPDPRIDVVLAIHPATALIGDADLVAMHKPVMVFSGSADTLLPPIDNSSRIFDLVSSERKFRVDVDNSGHGSPSNVCEIRAALLSAGNSVPQALVDSINLTAHQACDGGIIPSAYARGILNYFSTAFFDRTLKGLGGFGNEDQYPYLKRGYASAFQVCYWRDNDISPTIGSGVTSCLAS